MKLASRRTVNPLFPDRCRGESHMENEILELKKQGKTHKEISAILNCSLSVVSYHCRKNGFLYDNKINDEIIADIVEMYKTHTAKECAEKYNISLSTVKKYVEPKRKLLTKEEKLNRQKRAIIDRRVIMKEKAVDYKGGKCSCCGYDKYIGSLEFHHLNSNEKDFTISFLLNRKWEIIKEELDKCILVCSNCHREIHAGIRPIV